jgi:hypothetical protein
MDSSTTSICNEIEVWLRPVFSFLFFLSFIRSFFVSFFLSFFFFCYCCCCIFSLLSLILQRQFSATEIANVTGSRCFERFTLSQIAKVASLPSILSKSLDYSNQSRGLCGNRANLAGEFVRGLVVLWSLCAYWCGRCFWHERHEHLHEDLGTFSEFRVCGFEIWFRRISVYWISSLLQWIWSHS